MGNVIITEENFKRAHSEGSAEIKKVLENLAPEVFEKTYPCLKKLLTCGNAKGTVVLFTEPGYGIVVISNGFYPLGHQSVDWTESRFPGQWKLIKGIKEIE